MSVILKNQPKFFQDPEMAIIGNAFSGEKPKAVAYFDSEMESQQYGKNKTDRWEMAKGLSKYNNFFDSANLL